MSKEEFAEYDDNEMICKIQGVPCKCGIPCCNQCYEPVKHNKTRTNYVNSMRGYTK